MRQRLRLNADRNIGLVATVSARALNVASFNSLSGFDHHEGISPHRIRSSRRLPSWSSIVSIVVVGQTLKRARVFIGWHARTCRQYSSVSAICHQVARGLPNARFRTSSKVVGGGRINCTGKHRPPFPYTASDTLRRLSCVGT
jgi:hypothetical protein